METSTLDKRARTGLWLAAALSLVALWTRQRAKKAEKQFPASGNFIEVDGVRLHYIERGSGPPVVLLHGNGSRAEDFLGCGLIDRLATHHRVIAIDRPGFGFSERPRDRLWTPKIQAQLLRQALVELDAPWPIVVAHSFGTLVALALALDREAAVRGLVLVSGYYFPTMRLDTWLLSPPALPVVGDVMRYTVSPLLGKLMMKGVLRKLFSPHDIDPRFVASVPPPLMLRPWQIKAAAEESAYMVPACAAMSPHYGEIAAPVEIFAGVGDKHVKQKKQSVRLHAELLYSRLHLIAGEGHMLHYDMSGEIAQSVDRIAVGEAFARPAAAASRPEPVESPG